MAATPIVQHTICKYETYAIINDNEKIPMNPRYLLPILKADERLIRSYDGDVIESVLDQTYFTLGDQDFKVSIEVVEKEVTSDDFFNNYILPNGNYKNVEDLMKLISIASCSKGLLLSVYYMLYYSDEQEIINLSFLDNINTMNECDLYDIVLNTMEKLVLLENPIKYQDYIPTIEVDQMDLYNPNGDRQDAYHYDGETLGDAIPINIATNVQSYKNTYTFESNIIYFDEWKDLQVEASDIESEILGVDKTAGLIDYYEPSETSQLSGETTKWKIVIRNGINSDGIAYGYWNKTGIRGNSSDNYLSKEKSYGLFGKSIQYFDDLISTVALDGKLMTITKDGTIINNTDNLTIIIPAGTLFAFKHRFYTIDDGWFTSGRMLFDNRDKFYSLPAEIKIPPHNSWKMPNGDNSSTYYSRNNGNVLISKYTEYVTNGTYEVKEHFNAGSFVHNDTPTVFYVERSDRWWSEYENDFELGSMTDLGYYVDENNNESDTKRKIRINKDAKMRALTFYPGGIFGTNGYIKNNTRYTKVLIPELTINAVGIKMIKLTGYKVVDYVITTVVQTAVKVYNVIKNALKAAWDWFTGLFTKEETVESVEYVTETVETHETRREPFYYTQQQTLYHTIKIKNIILDANDIYYFGGEFKDEYGNTVMLSDYSTCTLSIGQSDIVIIPAITDEDRNKIKYSLKVDNNGMHIPVKLSVTNGMVATKEADFGIDEDKKPVLFTLGDFSPGNLYSKLYFYTNAEWTYNSKHYYGYGKFHINIDDNGNIDEVLSLINDLYTPSSIYDPICKFVKSANATFVSSIKFERTNTVIDSVNTGNGRSAELPVLFLDAVTKQTDDSGDYDLYIQNNKVTLGPANCAMSKSGNISIKNRYKLTLTLNENFIARIGSEAAKNNLLKVTSNSNIHNGFVWNHTTNETVVANTLYHINLFSYVIDSFVIKINKPNTTSSDYSAIADDAMFLFDGAEISIVVKTTDNVKPPYDYDTTTDIVNGVLTAYNGGYWNSNIVLNANGENDNKSLMKYKLSMQVANDNVDSDANLTAEQKAETKNNMQPVLYGKIPTAYDLYYYNGNIYNGITNKVDE